ncbi:hypothetical protein COBT_002348, partial [Conglomerata obtusa]
MQFFSIFGLVSYSKFTTIFILYVLNCKTTDPNEDVITYSIKNSLSEGLNDYFDNENGQRYGLSTIDQNHACINVSLTVPENVDDSTEVISSCDKNLHIYENISINKPNHSFETKRLANARTREIRSEILCNNNKRKNEISTEKIPEDQINSYQKQQREYDSKKEINIAVSGDILRQKSSTLEKIYNLNNQAQYIVSQDTDEAIYDIFNFKINEIKTKLINADKLIITAESNNATKTIEAVRSSNTAKISKFAQSKKFGKSKKTSKIKKIDSSDKSFMSMNINAYYEYDMNRLIQDDININTSFSIIKPAFVPIIIKPQLFDETSLILITGNNEAQINEELTNSSILFILLIEGMKIFSKTYLYFKNLDNIDVSLEKYVVRPFTVSEINEIEKFLKIDITVDYSNSNTEYDIANNNCPDRAFENNEAYTFYTNATNEFAMTNYHTNATTDCSDSIIANYDQSLEYNRAIIDSSNITSYYSIATTNYSDEAFENIDANLKYNSATIDSSNITNYYNNAITYYSNTA